MRVMQGRLQGSVAISDVARACDLSVSHFVRAFTNTVGCTPYAWFLSEKIAKAKQLLAEHKMPIAQIALACGFVDQSHFTNSFVRRVGITPYRWRRDLAQGEHLLL